MLLMGHLAIHGAAAVGLFVVAVGGVAGEVGVGVSGHGDGEEIFERPGAVEVEVRTIGGLNCSTLRVRRGRKKDGGGCTWYSKEIEAAELTQGRYFQQRLF